MSEGRRVFVVDDELLQLHVWNAILTKEGFKAETFSDAETALAEAVSAPPAAILLDRYMPNMDGREFLTRLRAVPQCAELPVIVVSGGADSSERTSLLGLGASDCVRKEGNTQEIVARLRLQLEIAGLRGELEARELRLRLAMEASEEGWWDWDVPAGRILHSPRFWTMLGLEPAGRPVDKQVIIDLIIPSDRGRVLDEIDEAFSSGADRYAIETEMMGAEGRMIPVVSRGLITRDAEGRPLRVTGTNTDLSEIKRMLNRSESQSRLLEAVMEAVPAPMFALDLGWRYVAFNSAHSEVMKALYGTDIAIGTRMLDCMTNAKDREAILENVQKTVRGNTVEVETYTGDQAHELRYFRILHNPVRNADGTVRGVLVLALDLSERKRAEQEILRLNTELEHRVEQRTASLRAFTEELEAFNFSVSHDLKAPLRAIDQMTLELEEELARGEIGAAAALVSEISSLSMRMRRLIDDLIMYSKSAEIGAEAVCIDMEALFLSVFEEIPEARRGKVRFSLGSLPQAWGDPGAVRRVVINLLENAVKFSSFAEEPEIVVSGAREGEFSEYSVRDNGAGFDPDYAAKLFAPFQRLHSEKEFPGTGLGLAIVRRIVIRHGGRVWAKGAPHSGAAFGFSLAACPERGACCERSL